MRNLMKHFRQSNFFPAFCILLSLAAVWWCLAYFSTSSSPIEGYHKRECKRNLMQLGTALHLYHEKHHSFPPAIVRDGHDRPYLSWRTLVLPFAEQADVYAKYQFDEAWDSPTNKALVPRVPEYFRCPSNRFEQVFPTTNYVAVIGPNTAWRSDGTAVSIKEITDGTSNTILLVETREAGIHVFEPRDLSLDQMTLAVNSPIGQGISSNHRLGGQSLGNHVLMADGTVRRLPDDTPPELIYALLTINGGEKIIDDDKGWRVER